MVTCANNLKGDGKNAEEQRWELEGAVHFYFQMTVTRQRVTPARSYQYIIRLCYIYLRSEKPKHHLLPQATIRDLSYERTA